MPVVLTVKLTLVPRSNMSPFFISVPSSLLNLTDLTVYLFSKISPFRGLINTEILSIPFDKSSVSFVPSSFTTETLTSLYSAALSE